MKNGIMYCKNRILESQTLRAVGELENIIDLQSFTGVNFNVPLVDRHSPLAISIANHLHYNVVKHKGAETIFRMSLQFARIIQGRLLFKDITDDCIFCKKLRLRYMKQIMGPLSDYQLSISPVFYYTYVDAWGPIKAYTPGNEKDTRASKKSFDLYMVVFGCAATATINIQVMEGGKDTDCFLDVFNRFFAEACVPKICFPDKDGALLKVLAEGEITMLNMEGVLSTEKGIHFRTCSAQDHSAHGRIEARIKMIQQSLERSAIKKEKLHSLGWQTVAKMMEREVNSVPLGYLHHETDMGPLLRVLTPNCLRLNTSSDRAPVGMFSVPNTAGKLITRIEDAYKLWYKIWNVDYISLIAQRRKWHVETENLVENDVYFKLKDSKLAQSWLIGKVEFVNISKDGKTRTVEVRKFSIVERPVRECIKLMNIENTSLLDDIKTVQKASQQLLDEDQVVPQHLLYKAFDDDIPTDEMQFDKTTEYFDEEDTAPKKTITTEKPKKERKKKKTELENLKINNWEPPRTAKRNRNISSLVNSTIAYHYMPLIIGLEFKSNKQEEVGVGNESSFVEGEEVLNENNPVLLM